MTKEDSNKEGGNQSISASARASAGNFSVQGCSPFAGEVIAIAGGHYERRGIQCKHSCVSDWKDVDWTSRIDEDEFDEFDNSCLALQELDLLIYKPFNAVLCRQRQYTVLFRP